MQSLESRSQVVRDKLKIQQANRSSLLKDIERNEKELAALSVEQNKNNELHTLVTNSIQIMYESLSARLGDIITEGIACIFPDIEETKFVIEFVPRRDTIEADLYLVDNDGTKYHPLDGVSGGMADLISLMLRITYIKLSDKRNLLLADEPLKFVDRSRIEDAAKFIKQICVDLDFKLILVTHIPELISIADRVYRVNKSKGISVTKEISSKLV